MDYVVVQGGKVPALGFGTWELLGEDCRKAVLSALDLGYRHIDTAQIYMNEDKVGRAIQESGVKREDLFLTTKVWLSNLAYGDVLKSVGESLRKLRTDYVDLLLIHWPYDKIPLSETLGAMNKLQEAGKAVHVGVSNFPVEWLMKAQEASKTPVFCDQVEYHPFLSQKTLLDYCQKDHILLTAYSPLLRGGVAGNEKLSEIGGKYEKTAFQVALRWLIQQKNVAAIPKAKSRKHQQENIGIFDFELTAREMREIFALASGRRETNPPFAPGWDVD